MGSGGVDALKFMIKSNSFCHGTLDQGSWKVKRLLSG